MTTASGGRGALGASFGRVFDAIQAANGGGRIERGAGYVKVCCPAHGEVHPSCSLTYDSARGKSRANCFVCNDDEAVLRAAGLTFADLYDEPLPPKTDAAGPRRPRSRPRPAASSPAVPPAVGKKAGKKDDKLRLRKVCEYVYRNVAGDPVGKVVRYDLVDDAGTRVDKSFRQYQFDPQSRRWCKGGFEPLLYRAPEVAAAIAAGELIHLTEGEKDADAAVELGGHGTTNPGGAGSFNAEHARQLAGARVVAILDRDLAGYDRGVRLNELLFVEPDTAVAELRLVEPAEDKDLADHRDRGHGLKDLVDVGDPAAKYVEAVPAAIDATVIKARAQGKPELLIQQTVRQMLDKARAMLDKVRAADDRSALAALLEQATAVHLGAEKPVDEVAERRRRRQQQAEAGAGEVGTYVEDIPEHSIPTSSGSWAFSTGENDEVPRGVYRGVSDGWQMVAPLPYVLERLNRRGGGGNRNGLSYRLAMRPLDDASEVVLCSDRDIRDGTWAEYLDVPLATDDKIVKAVATAIRQLGKAAPLHEFTPTWDRDNQLRLPPPDVLGGGYGEMHGSEDNAREVWRRIAELAGHNPKVAFAAAATLGGLFVKPLLMPQRSIWVHLVGTGQHGKTTTMHVAASLIGDPKGIIERWDTSGKGLGYRLGELGCLSVFRDELGTSSDLGTARDRETLILSLMEGAQRRVATREQGTKYSASWHGALVSSGNDSLIDGITNEAVYARVLELGAPITDSAEDCQALENLLTGRNVTTAPAYGWPLHWLRQDLNLPRFQQFIADAEQDLPLPAAGVPRTMGRNLCLTVAGAAELDRILGTSTLRPAALQVAQQLLTQLLGELADAGLKPGDRVLTAIVAAISSRPNSYPTRAQYLEALDVHSAKDTDGDAWRGSRKRTLFRDVEGWMLTDDHDIDGDVAVLSDKLADITKGAGITDPRPGLRELDRSGVLIRSGEAGGKRTRRIRLGSLPYRPPVYVFRLNQEDLLASAGVGDSNTGDSVPVPSTRSNTPEPDTPAPPGLSPVSPLVPGAEHSTGDNPSMPVTRTDVLFEGLSDETVPGVPGFGDTVAREDSMNEEERRHDGPATTERAVSVLDWDGLLAEAGDDREVLLDLWYLAQVEEPDNTALRERIETAGRAAKNRAAKIGAENRGHANDQADGLAGEQADTTPPAQPTTDRMALAGPCPPPLTGFTAACVVLDPTGLYLPDGTRHQPSHPIRDAHDALAVGQRLNIGHPGGPGQVILTDAMCVEVGLVAEADPGVAGDEARRQIGDRLRALGEGFLQRARDDGWDFDHFGPETRARLKRDGRTRVLDLVLTPYASLWTRGREEVTPFGALDPEETLSQEQYAAETARLMGHLAHLLHRPWRSSAVQAGFDLFDAAQRARKKNRGHVLTVPGRLPALTGDTTARDLVPALTWARWTPQRPADDADRARLAGMTHAVHLDRIGAWISAASQATLGYLTEDEPQMRQHHGVDAVAALLDRPEAVPAGVYRLRLPQLADPALPPLHAGQSTERPRWLWLPEPMVSTLIRPDDPTANVLGWGCSLEELLTPGDDGDGEDKQPEAWTFPAQGRILGGLWYETLRDARYALTGHPDLPETELIKYVYSGMLQSTQDTKPRVIEGKRGWHHQATWLSTVKAAHYAWQWHLLRRAIYADALVVHVDIDEIIILTADPATVSLGATKGKIGQYRHKKVRELTDQHREQLAVGVPADRLQGGEMA